MFNKKFKVIALMLCIVLMMGYFVVNTEAVSTVLLAVQGAIVDGNLVKFSGINGIGVDAGVSAANVVKCKFDATAAPTVNNDVDEGYTVGSVWVDVTNDKGYICLDNTDGAAVWTEVTLAGSGYTNLTSFVDQTAWRLFYSDNLGDVTELALGTDGQYLKSTGASSAPIFDTPGGAGDMLKATYDTDEDGDVDVAAGGTEKSSWTQYCIPYLLTTTAFGEIPIGTDNYALTVNGATGYDWTHLQVYDAGLLSLAGLTYVSDSFIKVTATDTYAIRTIAEVKTDLSIYSNLTSFVDQTAWRLFYSNTDGDVIELALGTDGQYLKSTGATSAPIFDTPSGAGDMLKATYDSDEDGDVDVAAGGTEKSAWTLYAIPYLSGTTAFGEITIGTAGQVLKVAAGATGYEFADEKGKNYYSALGSDHTYSANADVDSQPVGESVVFGDLLYFDWTDKEWKKAIASAYATTPAERIALESKTDGQTCLMLVKGYIRDDSAFDFEASRIFLNDDTAGTCDDTAPAESGDQIQIVGTAKSADILFFNPSMDVGEVGEI